jgi:dolichyl-diphosphooligosaccharide--protein glycosyltransferase
MFTAAAVFWVLNFFNITVNIRNVCVLLAPWFASNTTLVTYFMTKEVKNRRYAVPAKVALTIFLALDCLQQL